MADEASGFDRDDEDRDSGRADGADPSDDRTDRNEPTVGWNPSSRPVSSERDRPAQSEHGWTNEPDADGPGGDPDRIRLDLSSGDTTAEDDDEDETERDPRAPEPSSTPVEAGDPALENVLFVVLGAVATILVIVRFVSLPL